MLLQIAMIGVYVYVCVRTCIPQLSYKAIILCSNTEFLEPP